MPYLFPDVDLCLTCYEQQQPWVCPLHESPCVATLQHVLKWLHQASCKRCHNMLLAAATRAAVSRGMAQAAHLKTAAALYPIIPFRCGV